MKKYVTTLLFAGIFVFCVGVLSPVSALAFSGTHHLDCSSYGAPGQAYGAPAIACSSGNYGLNASNANGFYNNVDSTLFQINGQTIYVSYTYTGSGTVGLSESSGDGQVNLSGSQTDYAFTPTHSHTSISPVISADGGATAVGTVSNLCMSDSPTGCDPVVVVPYPSPFATTTMYMVVDNPNQDFANGVWFFLAGLFGMVYFFSKKR